MSPHRDTARLEDWAVETSASISTRLEAAKTAQSQIRWTLGAMAVISMMMLFASYNAYASYDYFWIIGARCPESTALVASPTASPTPVPADALREQAYKDWASSRTVLPSLLGVRVSVDDAVVLGTSVLLVLSLWLLLVARRENHTIGFLLRDTDTPDSPAERAPSAENRPKTYSDEKRWLIYHTIISNSLFVVFDRLPNVNTLPGPNSLEAADRCEGEDNRRREGEDEDGRGREGEDEDNRERGGAGIRLTRSFFFWFPMMASFAVFLVDWWSYIAPDPFEPGCTPNGYTTFFWVTRAVFVAVWLPLMICCVKSKRYSNATERVLCHYGRKLFADLKLKRPQKVEDGRLPD